MDAPSSDISVYTDFQGLSQLQQEAKTDPSGALKKVAQQFEALFIQMMLKSMREATTSGGLFDSDQMKTYTEMFDQQISLTLSNSRAMGIADMLARQLGGVVSKQEAAGDNQPSSAADGGASPPERVAPASEDGGASGTAAAPPYPDKAGSAATYERYKDALAALKNSPEMSLHE